MSQFANKAIWIVGASEGLGRALAEELSKTSAHLILSARNAERLETLAAGLPNAQALPVDVCDETSIAKAAAQIGRIDHVIYMAGGYEPMNTLEWDTASAIQMTDVNYLGALRVIGTVMPAMKAQGHGDISLIGSLSAYRGLPAAVGYGPSKAALQSLAETMRHDLKGSGITVRLINPGFIKTRLTDKNNFKMPQLMTPEQAADHVMRALKRKRFRTDFPRPFSTFIKLFHILPDWLAYFGK